MRIPRARNGCWQMSAMEFVADTDPRFMVLHARVRELPKETEQEFTAELRKALDEAYAKLSLVMVEVLKPGFEVFAAGLPAKFIRSQIAVYEMLSADITVAAQIAEQLARAGLENAASPSKKTH